MPVFCLHCHDSALLSQYRVRRNFTCGERHGRVPSLFQHRENIHTHTRWLTHTHFRTRLCQSSPMSWVLSCSTRRSTSSHSAKGLNRATLAKLNSTFVPGENRSPRAQRRISHFEWQRRSRGKITRLHKMDKGTGLLRPVILFIALGKLTSFW